MKERLRTAVKSAQVPSYLEARIRLNIESTQPSSVWRSWLVATAATILLCLGAATAYQQGHLRWSYASQESYIASVSNQLASVMRAGLADHIHCAVFRKYPKNVPPLGELEKTMGPKYDGLTKIVSAHVPSGYQLMMAHRCDYLGREFVHVALTGGGQVMSVLVTAKGQGESFATQDLVPALSESGIPIYRGGVQRFQIAAFESRGHLVYVISDESQQKNIDMLLAIAPALRQFLQKLES